MTKPYLTVAISAASILLAFSSGQLTIAAEPDPISENLTPPEQILSQRERIGLEPKQAERVGAVARDLHERLVAKHSSLRSARDKFSVLLADGDAAEERVMEAFGDILELENEMRRARLQMLLRVNRVLKPEQRAMLRAPEDTPGGDGVEAVNLEALKKQVETMRVKEVAWRKIDWKTCLLDGIQASREQNKPIVLWVFIDRPVDDKRC